MGWIISIKNRPKIKTMTLRDIVPPKSLILAPMAGYTTHYFRTMVRSMGATVTFTEMISAEGIYRRQQETLAYLKNIDSETNTVVQLFGGNPAIVAAAAAFIVDLGAKVIDINMGCPVKKVTKNGSGAWLMKNPLIAARMMALVKKEINVPLTIKIRAGWDEKHLNYLEIAKIAEDEGVEAITLHPRTRTQNYSTPARWDMIKQTVQSVSIPVIGNGDIITVHDALRMENETGCYALMIGREALRNPWIFNQFNEFKKSNNPPGKPSRQDIWELISSHLTQVIAEKGERKGIHFFRKFLARYLHGLYGVSKIRTQLFFIEEERVLRSLLQKFLLD
ncbi:tRNA dihydrouridine synthase DusB [candidate division CSSED10-310 bacterium]|uniref:tRNA-dihydrouridine synthase n=1 Tax=candidate division CSSED10-310 bacterium TaxID=2855610 RepID=A0ABV6YZF3_UNCC1